MIVLDTNVLSELMRPEPESAMVTWLDAQDAFAVTVTAITVAEIFYGIERLPSGKRKRAFAAMAADMFDQDFAGRILPFDEAAAVYYAEQVATSEALGRTVHTADAQIAVICRQHHATLATRNVKDFESLGIEFVNPWNL